jgi:heme-degrading monooxygenase HmoA
VASFTLPVSRQARSTLLDVWESQQAFESFQKDRLNAAVQKAGIASQPKAQFYPVHNIYVPNLEVIRKAGSTSLPPTA